MPFVRYWNPSKVVVVAMTAAMLLGACNVASTPAPAGGAPANSAIDQYQGATGALQDPATTLTVEVRVTGTTEAYALTGGQPPCPGYVNTAPNYVFNVTGELSQITVSFAGNGDATLAVVLPTGDILCGEPAASGLKPSQSVAEPVAGRYAVWVGRANMDGELVGVLEVRGAP